MDFDRIKSRLDALLAGGKKAELRGALNMLNEVDIAEYLETLYNEKMLVVFRLLPKDISAEVFSYMDNDQRTRIMEAMDDSEAIKLIDDMFIDDAVDFLEELPAGVVKRMLQGCDEKKRQLINQFLRYPENSAGSIMTIEYMEFHLGTTVGQAMAEIRRTGVDKETINTLYILDDSRKLLGTVGLRKLLLATDDRVVEDLMNTQVISVHTTDDQEVVADTVRKYDLLSIPVVDHEDPREREGLDSQVRQPDHPLNTVPPPGSATGAVPVSPRTCLSTNSALMRHIGSPIPGMVEAPA